MAALLAPPWQAAHADDPIDPPVYVCDSVLGTSESPLGHCTNEWENESAAEIMADEIDAIVFGGGAEGQISYQLDSGQDYAAAGSIAGTSERNEAFTFTPLFRSAIEDVPQDTHAWMVIGKLEGPTNIPAYVIGVIIHDETLEGAGLLVAGQVSPEIVEGLTGGPNLAGGGGAANCVANCEATRDAHMLVAGAALATAASAATAVFVTAAMTCARLALVVSPTGPWSVVGAVIACMAWPLVIYAGLIAAAMAVYSVAVNLINVNFTACMLGCGYYPL